MSDQNTNPTPGPIPPTMVAVVPPVQTPKISLMAKISSKIPPKMKEAFNKFYSNKKIFWPVSIVFGILFLTILVGLLFGSRNNGQTAPKKSPTPTPQVQENAPEMSRGSTETKLNQLKNQINGLDFSQSRLKPPSIDFKVSF